MNLPPASGIHVLIAEDDEDIRLLYKLMLEGHGRIRATFCDAPAKAIELLENGRYDVLLTDVVFKGIHAEQLETLLRRASGLNMGIIVCSGGIWEELPDVPNVIILQKGIDPNAIIAAIKTIYTTRTIMHGTRDNELTRLARPEEHYESPLSRWEGSILRGKGTGEDEHALYRQYIRDELDRAAACPDHYSKREMNELMDRYMRFVRSVKPGTERTGKKSTAQRRRPRCEPAAVSLRI